MIGVLRPYSEYQDSGVSWLGPIPDHWERVHGGAVLQQKKVRNRGMVEDTVLSLSYGSIVIKPPEKLHGLVPESFETYQVVDPGDIIIRPTDLQNDWTTIRVAIARDRGIITSAYFCFHVRKPLTPEYAHLLLLGYDMKKVFYGMGSGLRQNLAWSDFKRLPMLVPPAEEQHTIVRYIAWLDRQVHRFIRNRRRLIEVLSEQKQAIINRAVTRGLNPDVTLKPSGIDWLGEIPEHWNILPFTKYAIERADYRGATPEKVDSGIFLVTAKNIRKGWIDYEVSKEFVRTEDFSFIMRRGLPQCDDLLLTMEAPLGHLALVDREDISLAQRLVRFRMSTDHFMPKFVLHSALSTYFQNQMLCRGTGSTAIGIKASKLPQLRILQPTLKEQAEIVAKIDRVSAPLLDAIAKAQSEIDLIREYRTRLISDVVTGKIDVRHLAQPLGSEDLEEAAEALEPLEDLIDDVEMDEEEEVNESD